MVQASYNLPAPPPDGLVNLSHRIPSNEQDSGCRATNLYRSGRRD